MNARRALVVATLALGLTGGRHPAVAGDAAPRPPVPLAGAAVPDADPLVIEVVTFGPGNHPFSRFGHNAIRVRERRTGVDLVYNFGTFSIGPGMIQQFLHKQLRYWLSRAHTAGVFASYQAENRSIETQELELLPAEKVELVRRLEENALPENREYRYDYFLDNCSTRVRDTLDVVLGGPVRAVSSGVTGASNATLRGHALRMVADDVPLYLGLLIVLGPSTDRPIDLWGEDFLPEMLQRTLRQIRRADRPLVATERTLFAARRAAPRATPPRWWPAFLLTGLLAGAGWLALGRLGRRGRGARALFGLAAGLVGLIFGALGAFLIWAWVATPHAAVYRNQNILLFTPAVLAFVVLGPGVALGRTGAIRKLFLVAGWAGLSAIVALACKVLPVAPQANGSLILFLLPFWVGLTMGAKALSTPIGSQHA